MLSQVFRFPFDEAKQYSSVGHVRTFLWSGILKEETEKMLIMNSPTDPASTYSVTIWSKCYIQDNLNEVGSKRNSLEKVAKESFWCRSGLGKSFTNTCCKQLHHKDTNHPPAQWGICQASSVSLLVRELVSSEPKFSRARDSGWKKELLFTRK